MIRRFLQDESGTATIEYGLFAAAMGVTMIAAFIALRAEYITMFDAIQVAVTSASSP